MATTYRELRSALGTWCNTVLNPLSPTTINRIVVLANSGEAGLPDTAYISFILNENRTLGFPVTQTSEDGEIFTVTHTTQIRVQLDLYGGDDKDESAMQHGSTLLNSLYYPTRYNDLWLVCGLVGIEPMNDLTALETGVMKQRAQAVFTIIAELSDSLTTESFDTTEVEIFRADIEDPIETLIISADD